MKKLITLSLGVFVLLSCNNNSGTQTKENSKQSTISIDIKGSETVIPISEKTAQIFSNENPSHIVSVTGGGSGVGIAALTSGSTDIAQSSRKIKFSEQQKFQQDGKELKEIILAYDALAVIVHPENSVNELTREELEGIFTGKITNWNELGGENLKIVPYSRETSSGTYEFFKEQVLENKNFTSGIMSMPANGAIMQSVSQTKGAIAYVGMAYLNQTVQAVSVSYVADKYIEPTVENAKDQSYPIVRPLYLYYLGKSENNVKIFIDYILSPAGQKVVEEVGFIPLS